MSARATWKGLLKIALVQIPIKVYPATESSESISFNQLHAECQTRITQPRTCATCKREVPSSEIVKGFEFEKGRYVILSEEDFAQVKPESTRVIDLVQFAAAAALDPVHIKQSYYLAPYGIGSASEAFGVMRAAITGRVGIGKVAIYGREYLVAVREGDLPDLLILHTLHHAAEIRAAEAIEDAPPGPRSAVPPDQVRLAKQVIAAFTRPASEGLDLEAFTDQCQIDLRAIIDAKIAGKQIVVPPSDAPPVISLRDALTQSLLAVKATKPAKVSIDTKLQAPKAKRKRAS
jgi:DNA end-binding protein Ku